MYTKLDICVIIERVYYLNNLISRTKKWMKGLVKLKKKKFMLFLVMFLYLALSCVVFGCGYPKSDINQLPSQQLVTDAPQIKVTSIDTVSGPKALIEPTSSMSWEKVEETEPTVPVANPQLKENIAPQLPSGYLVTINLGSNKLTLFKNGIKVIAYPIASGRIDPETGRSLTPTGKFVVLNKEFDPMWVKYEGATPIAGGDPSNPLGHYWIGISAGRNPGSSVGVHGNADESSIGSYASSSCIRMHNSDVPQLYVVVPIGTPVWIGYPDQLTSWDVKDFE
jgi:lipoprotein-anchoring transpeptidase ErfK/SrfK